MTTATDNFRLTPIYDSLVGSLGIDPVPHKPSAKPTVQRRRRAPQVVRQAKTPTVIVGAPKGPVA